MKRGLAIMAFASPELAVKYATRPVIPRPMAIQLNTLARKTVEASCLALVKVI